MEGGWALCCLSGQGFSLPEGADPVEVVPETKLMLRVDGGEHFILK
jgi:hypothetical protein